MVLNLCKQAHHEKDIQTLSPKLCRFARKKQASLQVCAPSLVHVHHSRLSGARQLCQ